MFKCQSPLWFENGGKNIIQASDGTNLKLPLQPLVVFSGLIFAVHAFVHQNALGALNRKALRNEIFQELGGTLHFISTDFLFNCLFFFLFPFLPSIKSQEGPGRPLTNKSNGNSINQSTQIRQLVTVMRIWATLVMQYPFWYICLYNQVAFRLCEYPSLYHWVIISCEHHHIHSQHVNPDFPVPKFPLKPWRMITVNDTRSPGDRLTFIFNCFTPISTQPHYRITEVHKQLFSKSVNGRVIVHSLFFRDVKANPWFPSLHQAQKHFHSFHEFILYYLLTRCKSKGVGKDRG